MIKVLLVDDEKLALEYLEHIIDWEYHGFELIGVTTNPEQALAIYKTHRPDLVISDVKMPGLNGLELGDAIREYGGNTHILFLSAYKNFDYVKQAIRLGIDDYILKSDLEEDGFLRKILKLKEEIIKEKAKKQYTITAILEELFRKNISEEVYKDILDENDYIGLHKKYYYIIVSQRKVPKILKKYIPLDNNQMTLDNRLIKRACENVSENTGIHVGARFPVNEDEYLILLEFGKGIVSQKEINDRIYDFARKLYEYINREEKLYHVYYCLHGSMVRQFRSNFTNYQRQLENNILKNEEELQELRYDGKEENEKKLSGISSEEIYQSLQHGKTEEIEKIENRLHETEKKQNVTEYLEYIEHILEALSLFDGKLIGETSGQRFLMTEGCSSYDFRKVTDLQAYIEYKIEEICRMKNEKEKMIYSDVTINAMAYINQNYGDASITAAEVAEHVGVTSSWLSTKFKTETGIRVNDFINNVRIENAKKMFQDKEYMVYEVSEKTGFTSSQYFSKIFKEYTGLTPNQYRRKLLAGE